jgi:polyisoprenoid-binding protein YceI
VKTQDEKKRSPLRWIKWVVIGLVAVVALGYGAIFFYTEVINDSPDKLGTSDLEEVLQQPDTTDTGGAGIVDTATGGETPTTSGSSGTQAAAPASIDGTWNATPASELGYRVKENLFGVDAEAVGRTHDVTGSLTIDGTAVTEGQFVVDMTTVTSDESRRDSQFRGQIMSTDEFPTATFTLTSPIELDAIPEQGEQITATATGDLTLHGVTKSVTFDVTAQQEADRIGVLGSIPIVFADYSIPNPSFGGVKTEDHGVIEFVLVFEQA